MADQTFHRTSQLVSGRCYAYFIESLLDQPVLLFGRPSLTAYDLDTSDDFDRSLGENLGFSRMDLHFLSGEETP